MQRRVSIQEPEFKPRRFTRRIVKKMQPEPEPEQTIEQDEDFFDTTAHLGRSKTMVIRSEVEVAGAGAGGQLEAPYGYLAVRKMTPVNPVPPPTLEMKLRGEQQILKAALEHANALAGKTFGAASVAKTGAEYNELMDKYAIYQTEVLRLHDLATDLEDRLFRAELLNE
jgi:hypothetical protein